MNIHPQNPDASFRVFRACMLRQEGRPKAPAAADKTGKASSQVDGWLGGSLPLRPAGRPPSTLLLGFARFTSSSPSSSSRLRPLVTAKPRVSACVHLHTPTHRPPGGCQPQEKTDQNQASPSSLPSFVPPTKRKATAKLKTHFGRSKRAPQATQACSCCPRRIAHKPPPRDGGRYDGRVAVGRAQSSMKKLVMVGRLCMYVYVGEQVGRPISTSTYFPPTLPQLPCVDR